MTFDPDHEPENIEEAEAYVQWCADQLERVVNEGAEGLFTYRRGLRAAHWMLVVACAHLRLDDDYVGDDRDALMHQIDNYADLAVELERQRERYPVERLIVLRASLDCWEPVGRWAHNFLGAAKSAVAALMLVEFHPLIDLWELHAPDVWALIHHGMYALQRVQEDETAGIEDCSIRRDEDATAKFTWQRAMNISKKTGAPPPSMN